MFSLQRCAPRCAAFTLIELLTVVAIIGILAAILIPTVGAARSSALRAKTRVQFNQWATAIEAFRQEYGFYPAFDASDKVNGGAGTSPGGLHRFHDVLASRRRDGTPLPVVLSGSQPNPPPPEFQNRRRIAFITFAESDLLSDAHVDAAKRNLLRDAFEGTDVAVLVDRNLDGRITIGAAADGYASLPTVSPPDNPAVRLQPLATDFPPEANGGVRAGVLFYCAPPHATEASQLILSWK